MAFLSLEKWRKKPFKKVIFVFMAGSQFGTLFKLTSFGESHGLAIGGVIEGCPAGLDFDFDFIQGQLDRRRPGQSKISTSRKESDTVEFLSGIFEGKSTGTPIGFILKNEDHRSKDYEQLKSVYRPSHADFVWEKKYGFRDYRGGGRSSARETASRVVAGAVAQLILKHQGISIHAYVQQVGHLSLETNIENIDLTAIENNSVRCPDAEMAQKMEELILEMQSEGDSLGGVIQCIAENVPVGLGEPVFDKLHADLAKAMMSINAVKGFEIGSGFEGAKMQGSVHNDPWIKEGEEVKTAKNHSGGIQGGISNGAPIYFRTAFKPVATIKKEQKTLNQAGEEVIVEGKGRHDPCVVPRAVPIVEGMTALVLCDHLLRNKLNKLDRI